MRVRVRVRGVVVVRGGRWTEGKEETVVTPVVDPLYGGGGGEGERGGDGRGERTRKW